MAPMLSEVRPEIGTARGRARGRAPTTRPPPPGRNERRGAPAAAGPDALHRARSIARDLLASPRSHVLLTVPSTSRAPVGRRHDPRSCASHLPDTTSGAARTVVNVLVEHARALRRPPTTVNRLLGALEVRGSVALPLQLTSGWPSESHGRIRTLKRSLKGGLLNLRAGDRPTFSVFQSMVEQIGQLQNFLDRSE